MLASGAGSTFAALLDAAPHGLAGASVAGLVSDREDAGAVARAREAGIPVEVVPLRDPADRPAFDAEVAAAVARHAPDLVVLAGFMRVLGPAVVTRFPVVNTHPSLLPAFPGARAVADALAHGVRVSGCTVHVVDEGVDTGPILGQAAVPVFAADDEAALRARVQAVERGLLVDVVARLVADGLPGSLQRLAPPRRRAGAPSTAVAPPGGLPPGVRPPGVRPPGVRPPEVRPPEDSPPVDPRSPAPTPQEPR